MALNNMETGVYPKKRVRIETTLFPWCCLHVCTIYGLVIDEARLVGRAGSVKLGLEVR